MSLAGFISVIQRECTKALKWVNDTTLLAKPSSHDKDPPCKWYHPTLQVDRWSVNRLHSDVESRLWLLELRSHQPVELKGNWWGVGEYKHLLVFIFPLKRLRNASKKFCTLHSTYGARAVYALVSAFVGEGTELSDLGWHDMPTFTSQCRK